MASLSQADSSPPLQVFIQYPLQTDAGRAFSELEGWALQYKGRIGTLYHLNRLRLEQWDPERPLTEQSAAFYRYHEALKAQLQRLHEEATRIVADNDEGAPNEGTPSAPAAELSKSARTKRKKVLASLLEHWPGLTVFVEHPEVPMDNNLAENTIRTPVTGRRNYYGSGSIWSAQLAATLFAILQTLVLWGVNPRHWLRLYLTACAENGGSAPRDIDPFLPRSMFASCIDERHSTLFEGMRAHGHYNVPIMIEGQVVPLLSCT